MRMTGSWHAHSPSALQHLLKSAQLLVQVSGLQAEAGAASRAGPTPCEPASLAPAPPPASNPRSAPPSALAMSPGARFADPPSRALLTPSGPPSFPRAVRPASSVRRSSTSSLGSSSSLSSSELPASECPTFASARSESVRSLPVRSKGFSPSGATAHATKTSTTSASTLGRMGTRIERVFIQHGRGCKAFVLNRHAFRARHLQRSAMRPAHISLRKHAIVVRCLCAPPRGRHVTDDVASQSDRMALRECRTRRVRIARA